jgi:hypothetical protein
MLVLPHTSIVNRVVPKNSFDKFINTKQKKLFSEYVDKIKWANKLSTQTVKLEGKDIKEIQVFEILLKKKHTAEDVLNIIDRFIPYHIIFVLRFDNELMYSVAQKHPNPNSEDNSVIDWRFISNWVNDSAGAFKLNLKKSLDDVFADFCLQVSGKVENQNKSLQEIIGIEQRRKQLLIDINKLESEIKSCKQFNLKVELNLKLNEKKIELKNIENK